jgi:hypothetical protein
MKKDCSMHWILVEQIFVCWGYNLVAKMIVSFPQSLIKFLYLMISCLLHPRFVLCLAFIYFFISEIIRLHCIACYSFCFKMSVV